MTDAKLPDKPLLKHGEVARYLNVSPNGLHDLCKQGKGPPRIRIGKKIIRYDPEEFQEWFAKHIGGYYD